MNYAKTIRGDSLQAHGMGGSLARPSDRPSEACKTRPKIHLECIYAPANPGALPHAPRAIATRR